MSSLFRAEADALKALQVEFDECITAVYREVKATSKQIIDSMYQSKREKNTRKWVNELAVEPFGVLGMDIANLIIIQAHDQKQGIPPNEGSALKYLEARNIVQKDIRQEAINLVEGLVFEEIMDYISFFKRNSVEDSIDYVNNVIKKRRSVGTLRPKLKKTLNKN